MICLMMLKVSILKMHLGITNKFEITVRFFCKNDKKNDLETLYYFTTNLLEEK